MAFLSKYAYLQPFVCGGLAAMTASSAIHPIDLAKVRLQLLGQHGQAQMTARSRTGALSMLRAMIRADGVGSVYAGLSASLVRQATYGTARIGLHDAISKRLRDMRGGTDIPFTQKTAAGMLSGAMAVCVGSPFDVVMVRMQADSLRPVAERRNYTGVLNALTRVVREEGPSKLFRGLGPNLLRGMSMNAGMMAFYDQAVEAIQRGRLTPESDPARPSLPTQLMASATAGFACAFLSLPFDFLKSRLQDQTPGAGGRLLYRGMVDCAGKTLRNEGPFAFWTGFGAYYARCAPHAMIILLTREQITRAYQWASGLSPQH